MVHAVRQLGHARDPAGPPSRRYQERVEGLARNREVVVLQRGDVSGDGFACVRDSILAGEALRYAAGKARTFRYPLPVLTRVDHDLAHGSSPCCSNPHSHTLVHRLATPLPFSLECFSIERLPPPRFLRGEKVAEGRMRGEQIRGTNNHASSELPE